MEDRVFYEEDDEIIVDLGVLKNDIFKGIRKLWLIGVLLIILGAGTMALITQISYIPLYQTRVSFTIVTNQNSAANENEYGFYYEKSTASLLADAFPYVINSSAMQSVLKKDLGTDEINGYIWAEAIENTNIFMVSVTSDSAKDAYDIINALIKDYPELAKYVIGDSQLNIIQKPVMPDEICNPVDWKGEIGKGILIGLGIWGVMVLLYAFTRRTIRKEDDIYRKLNKFCFGTVPLVKKYRKTADVAVWVKSENGNIQFRESMNRIATRLVQKMKKDNQKILVMTSAAPDEGKSTVVMNLAAVLSQRDFSVLIIDADLYQQNSYINMNETEKAYPDLIQYCEDKASIENIIYHSKELNCDVIAGNTNSNVHTAGLLGSEEIERLLDDLRKRYDYILIDTPPSETVSDAMEISRYADAAVFIIRYDAVAAKQILDAMENMYDSRIQIIGCVLNGVTGKSDGYDYQKYGYGKKGYVVEK